MVCGLRHWAGRRRAGRYVTIADAAELDALGPSPSREKTKPHASAARECHGRGVERLPSPRKERHGMSNRDRRRGGAGRDEYLAPQSRCHGRTTGSKTARSATSRRRPGRGCSPAAAGPSSSGPRLIRELDRCTLCAVDEVPARPTAVPG